MFATWGVVLALWFVATTGAIRQHGSAPYANITSIPSYAPDPSTTPLTLLSAASDGSSATVSSSITSEPGYAQPTEQRPSIASLSATSINSIDSTNGTNSTTTASPCTVNIPNAKFEWWYAATFASAAGTLTSYAPNFTNVGGDRLTVVSRTDTFNVANAISTDFGWTESIVHDSVYGDWTNYEQYTVMPTAATTSIVTRDGATPLPSGNIVPKAEVRSYLLNGPLPPASITIAGTANATSAVTSATPFLYFTAYEVESVLDGTTTTSTVDLAQPSATEYWIKGIEDSSSATGAVPEDFLQQIDQSTCSPGTVQGEVTVLVVLDIYWVYVSFSNPFLVHFESSELGFEETDTDMIVAVETSRGTPFTEMDPQWTEDLGKVTTEDQPRLQTANPQPTQGPKTTPNVPQPTQQTVGAVGTNPVVVAPSSVVIVGTQTLKPGAPAVTIGGVRVSLAPSATAIVIGGTTSVLPIMADPGSPAQTVGTVGGRPIVLGPSSAIIIGTATLNPGQPPVTIGGTIISVAPSASAIVVGGQTSALPQVIFPADAMQTQAPAPPVLTIGSSTFTANVATQFFVSPGQTLTPGGTVIVDGTVVSLGPSASFVVVGGSTQILPTGSSGATARPEIVVGGATITALPGDNSRHGIVPFNGEDSSSGPTFIVSGQTLAPGHVITVDGTTLSLAPSGSLIVVNGVTSTISTSAQITAPPITIGGSVYAPLSGTGGSYTIGTALLTPGGELTISGTTISLASDGSNIVINGVTSTLHEHAHATITNPPLVTIGSQTYTAEPGAGTTFVIGGQTLLPGGTIIVDGTTIYLAPGATELIYGSAGRSTTEALFPATTTRGPSTTGIVSATASAGGSSGDGRAAATSSTVGVGRNLQALGWKSWTSFVVIGFLNLHVH